MADTTNWSAVTNFFDSVIEEAAEPIIDSSNDLVVWVYSPALDQRLSVVVPRRSVEDFMKRLPLYEAHIERNLSRDNDPQTRG